MHDMESVMCFVGSNSFGFATFDVTRLFSKAYLASEVMRPTSLFEISGVLKVIKTAHNKA